MTLFRDRHGKERLRFRRTGYPSGYFRAPLGTEAFRIEYRAFMDAVAAPITPPTPNAPGSIADLVTRYLAVPSRLGPTATTQAKVRRIVDRFRMDYGDLPVERLGFEHVDAIVAGRVQKRQVGKRIEGGVEAARKLRKELVRLFDFAVKIGMRADNPVRQSERVRVAPGERSTGYHSWTEEEIAQYRAHHALGTRARLAMELLLWTDQRRGDTIHLGRQHIRDGCISVRQSKTGAALQIPVAPQLLEAIVAMSPADTGDLCFLVTEYGRPFTSAGFGNFFRDQCDAAGLPHCSAHGLRKATMRRMAEIGLTNQIMKAVSGHRKDDEVARYTASANQRSMAEHAIRELSQWEMSNLRPGLDKQSG